jgi:glycosyltransferase involved in cell wall biosynthesis
MMQPPKRILFAVSHRLDRAPNQRFRFEQYLGLLQANGFECVLSPLLDEEDDKRLYAPGLLGKALVFLKAGRRRMRDVLRAGQFDIVFVPREAFLTGTTWFEKEMKANGPKLIFDFDDAIWLANVSEANKRLAFLKNPNKTTDLIAMSDLVLAGNNYLAEYARRFNPKTVVLPTTVDTDEYDPARFPRATHEGGDEPPFVIGWSGSPTTIQHFEYAVPFLKELKAEFGNRIDIRVVGDGSYRNAELGITGIPWRRDDELQQLSKFDAGIMPLPDDEWTRGKCGLKGLVYMSMGIPSLMSPVGVNTEIIEDGVNGFLPRNTAQWVERIRELMESPDLRKKLGSAGRQTVLERYSVHSQGLTYVNLFRQLAGLEPLEALAPQASRLPHLA